MSGSLLRWMRRIVKVDAPMMKVMVQETTNATIQEVSITLRWCLFFSSFFYAFTR